MNFLNFLRLFLVSLFFLVIFSCCSWTQKIALSTTVTPIIKKSAEEMETESNWETFKGAILSHIKLIEGLLALSPQNKDLLANALKAHSVYAFGVVETEWLEKKEISRAELALQHYSRAIDLGYRYLEGYGIHQGDLFRSIRKGKRAFFKLLSDLEDERGLDVVFFLAQSLSSSINLQKTSPMAVAYLPLSKGLFDWVCSLRPSFRYGACSVFYGAWEVSRPRVLGGNRSKAKEHFISGMKQYPENYLIAVSYFRFYLIPGREIVAREREKIRLEMEEKFKKWSQKFLWPETDRASFTDDRNLYNAIAKKQFELMTRKESK